MLKWIPHVMAFVVGFFGAIFFWGVFDGLVSPVRRDYALRMQVVEALRSAAPAKAAISSFYEANGVMCASKDTCGIGDPGSDRYTLSIGSRGLIALTMHAPGTPLDGTTITLRPQSSGDSLTWSCTGGDVRPVYRPASCRARRTQ